MAIPTLDQTKSLFSDQPQQSQQVAQGTSSVLFDFLRSKPEFVQSARELGYEGPDDDIIKNAIADRRWIDSNVMSTMWELGKVSTSDDEKTLMARGKLREIWQSAPDAYDHVKSGRYGQAAEAVWANLWRGTLDPSILLGGIVGKAVGGTAGVVGGTAAGVAVDASIAGVADMAHQNIDMELGIRKEGDPKQTLLAMGIGSVASLPGNIGSAKVGASLTAPSAPTKAPGGPRVMGKSQLEMAKLNADNAMQQHGFNPVKGDQTSFIRDKFDQFLLEAVDPAVGLKRIERKLGLKPTTNLIDDIKAGKISAELLPSEEHQLMVNSKTMADIAVGSHTFDLAPTGDYIKNNDVLPLRTILEEAALYKDGANSLMKYVAAVRSKSLRQRLRPERATALEKQFDKAVKEAKAYAAGTGPKPRVMPNQVVPKSTDYINPGVFTPGQEMDIIRSTPQQMKDVASQLKKYTDWLLDLRVKSGLLTQKEAKNIADANPFYVPFFRELDSGGVQKGSSRGKLMNIRGVGYDDQGKPIVGHNINDLVDNMLRATTTTMEDISRNRMNRSVGKLLQTVLDTNPAMFKQYARKFTSKKQALSYVGDRQKLGYQFEGTPDNYFVLSSIPRNKPSNRVLSYKEGGKEEFWEIIDPMLMRSLNAYNPEVQGSIVSATMNILAAPVGGMKGIQAAKQLTTDIITHNPAFAMYTAPIRDMSSAMFFSTRMHVPVWDFVKGYFKSAVGSPDYMDFLLNGGGFVTVLHTEGGRQSVAKQFKADTKALTNVVQGNDVMNILKKLSPLKQYQERLIYPMEHANRTAEYSRIMATTGSRRLAALGGREVSIDFGRKGASPIMRDITSMAPFLNAAIQSTYKVGRTLTDPAKLKGRLPVIMSTMMAGSYAMHKMNSQYPVYQSAYDWQKDGFILIPFDSETGELYPEDPMAADEMYKIPVGYDLGMMSWMLPRRFMEMGERNEGYVSVVGNMMIDWFSHNLNYLGNGFTEFAPVVGPVVGLYNNEKWTGTPYLSDEQDMRRRTGQGHTVANATTPDVYRVMAEKWNAGVYGVVEDPMYAQFAQMTPIGIQGLVEGIFMWTGKLTADGIDHFADVRDKATRGEDPYNAVRETIEAFNGDYENVDWSQVPYARVMHQDVGAMSVVWDQRMRPYLKWIEDNKASLSNISTEAILEDPFIVDKVLKVNPDVLRTNGADSLIMTYRQLDKYFDDSRKLIELDNRMTSKQKVRAIKENYLERATTMRDYYYNVLDTIGRNIQGEQQQ